MAEEIKYDMDNPETYFADLYRNAFTAFSTISEIISDNLVFNNKDEALSQKLNSTLANLRQAVTCINANKPFLKNTNVAKITEALNNTIKFITSYLGGTPTTEKAINDLKNEITAVSF
jgi:hypothetical protein